MVAPATVATPAPATATAPTAEAKAGTMMQPAPATAVVVMACLNVKSFNKVLRLSVSLVVLLLFGRVCTFQDLDVV